MTRTLISLVVFLAGLAVAGWIGAGYIGSNPLALAIIGLIGVVYLTGAIELLRYQRATNALASAVNGLTVAPASLDGWLTQLPANLRGAVRLRIEGPRVALPGPALTPYLVGMLVLLGMLGTFLGMVATLRGTGIALESAVDLQAIRSSLASPIQGLGFAFGTSVAGVATSAALGLLATICRRSRIQAAQSLDVMIATTLRPFSQNHQGEQTYKLLQQQAHAMPELVDRLQTMIAAMEKQTNALHERLATSQDAFYGRTEMAYTRLAGSLEASLKQTVVESARAAGEAIQPAVQQTLAGLARETSAWQDTLALAIRQQLETLSGRFEATTSSVADIWQQALAKQEQTNSRLAEDNQRALTTAAATLERHAQALVHSLGQSHTELQDKLVAQDQARLDSWQSSIEALAAKWNTSLQGTAGSVHETMTHTASTLQASLADVIASLDASLKATSASLREQWQQTTASAADQQQRICQTLATTARELTDQTQAHARETISEVSQLLHTVSQAPKAAAEVIAELRQSHVDLQSQLIAQDQQRLNDWKSTLDHIASHWNQSLETSAGALHNTMATTASSLTASLTDTAATLQRSVEGMTTSLDSSLKSTAATLSQEWAQSGTQAAQVQQAICDTLARTAQELSTQTQAQARDTIREVAQLLHIVSEAPKAAAEVIAELRQSHVDLQDRLISLDQQRLDTWKTSLDKVAATWNRSLENTTQTVGSALQSAAETVNSSLQGTAQTVNASMQGHAQEISATLQTTAQTVNASIQSTVDSLNQSLQSRTDALATTLEKSASAVGTTMQDIATSLDGTLQSTANALNASLEKTATTLDATLQTTATSLSESLQSTATTLTSSLQGTVEIVNTSLEKTTDTVGAKLDDTASSLNAALLTTTQALTTSLEDTTNSIGARMEDTAASLSASLQGTTSTLTVTLENTASSLHNTFDDIASSLNVSLENTAYTLRQEWEQASTQAAQRQQEICDTLARTADEIATSTKTHASETIAEVAQLVQAAAEAPRVAASVISELRQKLTDAMARDNEMLEERTRLMDTLSTLLDAVNHASTQQRETVDSLISHSSELLERVGSQFTAHVQRETEKLADVSAQLTGSAVEVASLGEVFGTSVERFQQSNDKLLEHLQRVEAALDKSMARSDEQLAYYVAQAREVVDLSILSQKQIIEDLQRLAGQQQAVAHTDTPA
ncbi:DUF802 domain-containing protein [Bordetella sp. 02P26C-1]|uniref:DUF802 domain-containing protein n=1 Tax=Bordetella sp. 02P26C-1 TaxID=2683195 RepID=UPI0013533043|nr:DUF802 domain-containing protein [Bordetella sp. 02P26C-1]MVW79486.1 DUF802 domain-containing protein [Bordetella sp. 02P26C-1]